MSEPLYDILLHAVNADTNTNVLAQKLSKFLGVSVQNLEMQMVKVKLSQGKAEVLVSGLPKEKADRVQTVFERIGLKTSLKLAVSLVPIKETANVNIFTCPACGIKQESKKGSEHKICSECGVVKEKYEEVQGFKKYEEDVIKHNKLIDAEEKTHTQKAAQEKFNKQLDTSLNKKLRQKMSTKQKLSISLSVMLGFTALGGGVYWYLESQNNKLENTDVRSETRSRSAKGVSSTSKPANKSVVQSPAMAKSSADESAELGNPYDKFANPNMKKVSLEEGVKKINSLLNDKKLKLPNLDKAALKEISQIYTKAESHPTNEVNYSSIKRIAKTINNKKARNAVEQHVTWGEIESGLKTFDELGIYPSVRKGEEAPAVQVSKKLIGIYVDASQFEDAVEETEQITDPYLKVVTLNKIMKTMVKEKADGVVEVFNRISVISQSPELSVVQSTLISGILAQGEILLGNKEMGESRLESSQQLVRNIKKPRDQISTLIQLSEDQREGMGFKFASIFLHDARLKLKRQKMSRANKDQAYSSLAEQYAKLLDFPHAKRVIKKIKSKKKKTLVSKTIAIIEIKAAKGA